MVRLGPGVQGNIDSYFTSLLPEENSPSEGTNKKIKHMNKSERQTYVCGLTLDEQAGSGVDVTQPVVHHAEELADVLLGGVVDGEEGGAVAVEGLGLVVKGEVVSLPGDHVVGGGVGVRDTLQHGAGTGSHQQLARDGRHLRGVCGRAQTVVFCRLHVT